MLAVQGCLGLPRGSLEAPTSTTSGGTHRQFQGPARRTPGRPPLHRLGGGQAAGALGGHMGPQMDVDMDMAGWQLSLLEGQFGVIR